LLNLFTFTYLLLRRGGVQTLRREVC